MGFGLTREMVSNVVMDYLNDEGRPNPFPHSKPGNDWWLEFMRRWPSLKERKPQHLQVNRATALSEGAVNAWFSKVSQVLEDAGLGDLPPDELGKRMWNCDETAFATDVASKKILAKRGDKHVHETGGGSGREYITVLGCGSGNGERLPPYVVYKGKNLWSSWIKGGPAATLYTVSDSGWMERPHFLEWFRNTCSLYPCGNWPGCPLHGWTCFPYQPGVDQACKRAGSDSALLTVTHYPCSAAPGRWCLWASQKHLEKNPEGVQDGDVCRTGR